MGFIEDLAEVPTKFLEGLFNKGKLGYVVIAVIVILLWLLKRNGIL